MKTLEVEKHVTKCLICYDCDQRGYESEALYWDDFFNDKLKPIKFILTYRGKVVKEPESKEI